MLVFLCVMTLEVDYNGHAGKLDPLRSRESRKGSKFDKFLANINKDELIHSYPVQLVSVKNGNLR